MPFFPRRVRLSPQRNAPVDANDGVLPIDNAKFAQQAEALIPAEVRMISGCHSEQTSADVSNVKSVAELPNPAGRSGGAATSALLEILYAHHRKQQQTSQTSPSATTRQLTFQELLLELRQTLSKRGFDQIPQLTSSRPLELEEMPFSCRNPNGNGICRALIVGINYRGMSGALSGCHNDAYNVKKYLVEVQGFQPEHILMLLDDDGEHHYPNRYTIILALKQLVAQSRSGDSVYFHYSGHGGLLNPVDGWKNVFKANNKEFDETIYPLDHVRAGQIRDFSLFHNFVKPMPAGVTVTCVFDCCHSGAVLELPYSFRPTDVGTIRMRQSMNSLSNLAFLYLLGGGVFPGGGLFDSVTHNIESVTGGTLDDFQGAGMEEAALDNVSGIDQAADYDGDVADLNENNDLDLYDASTMNPDVYGDSNTANYGDTSAGDADFGNVTQGYAVPAETTGGYDGVWAADNAFDNSGGRWDSTNNSGGDAPDMNCGDAPDLEDCGCVADVIGSMLGGQ